MIKLHKIKLTNFGKIDHAEIELDSSLFTLIVGKNGSGKSTILQGIALCLSDYKRSGTYKEYIKHGTNYCEVELLLDVHNEPMMIKTIIVPDKSKVEGGKLIKYKAKEYRNNEAKNLLKSLLDINLVNKIIFSHQKAQNITNMTPSERRELLKKLISFNFSDASTKIKQDILAKKEEGIRTASKLEVLNSNTFTKHILPETKTEVQLLRLKSSIDSFELQVKELEKEEIEFNFNKKNIQETLKNKEKNELLITQNETKLNDLITQSNTAQEEKRLLELNISDKALLVKDKENQYKELGKKNYLSLKDDEKAIIANAKAQITTLLSDLSLLKEGKCSVCKQDVENMDSLLNDKKELIALLEKTINQSQNTIEKYNQIIKDKEQLTIGIDKLNSEISNDELDIRMLDNKINTTLLESTKSVQETLAYLREQNKDIEVQEVKCFPKAQNLQDKKDKLANQKASYDTELKTIETKKTYTNLNKQIEKDKELNDKEVLKLQDEVKSIDDSLEDMTSAKKAIEITIPNFAIMKTCTILENSINRFISEVKSSFPIKLSSDKKGITFMYSPLNNGIWAKVSNASGFESELISLAFQSSLAKMFNIEVMILDEVDSSADIENSKKFYTLLSKLKDFQQVIVITHKEKVIDILKDTNDCHVVNVIEGEVIS